NAARSGSAGVALGQNKRSGSELNCSSRGQGAAQTPQAAEEGRDGYFGDVPFIVHGAVPRNGPFPLPNYEGCPLCISPVYVSCPRLRFSCVPVYVSSPFTFPLA